MGSANAGGGAGRRQGLGGVQRGRVRPLGAVFGGGLATRRVARATGTTGRAGLRRIGRALGR